MADFLIKAGADIELGCSTPLMEAAQEGHLELVKYLLAAGEQKEKRQIEENHPEKRRPFTFVLNNPFSRSCYSGANVHATTATGDTALTYACENGHTDVADVLLQAGANLVRHDLEASLSQMIGFDSCFCANAKTDPRLLRFVASVTTAVFSSSF